MSGIKSSSQRNAITSHCCQCIPETQDEPHYSQPPLETSDTTELRYDSAEPLLESKDPWQTTIDIGTLALTQRAAPEKLALHLADLGPVLLPSDFVSPSAVNKINYLGPPPDRSLRGDLYPPCKSPTHCDHKYSGPALSWKDAMARKARAWREERHPADPFLLRLQGEPRAQRLWDEDSSTAVQESDARYDQEERVAQVFEGISLRRLAAMSSAEDEAARAAEDWHAELEAENQRRREDGRVSRVLMAEEEWREEFDALVGDGDEEVVVL